MIDLSLDNGLKSTLEECIKDCCDGKLNFKLDKNCLLSIYPNVKCQYMSTKYSERCAEGVRYHCFRNDK